MIKIEIDGFVRRSFTFPANLNVAFDHFRELSTIVEWLPHITMVECYDGGKCRLLYHSVELSLYEINIYCDLDSEVDDQAKILRLRPVHSEKTIKPQANLHALTVQGYYASESVFTAEGGQTRIDYQLNLRARLPVPTAARLMPASVLDMIARNVMNKRIDEIVSGFINRSIQEYQKNS